MTTKTITITITARAKATSNCFKDFAYRDSDLDKWLPKKQPAQSGEITVIILDREQTFLEMAQQHLGSTDVGVIKKLTLTLPMVEKMVEEHSDELNTDGWGNLFFVENGEGGVSIAIVRRHGSGWRAFVYGLGYDLRWHADGRLLVRNLGHSDSSDTLSLENRVAELEAWRERMAKWIGSAEDTST